MEKINISQVDTIFANGSYPIEFLLYYKNKLESKNIRTALKEISPAFWPIFGDYEDGVIYFEKYSESECFDEELCDYDFDPGEPAEAIFNNYRNSIQLKEEKLFFLKIIQLKNGTIIIPKLNHLAGDGYSYFYFLLALSALSRESAASSKENSLRHLFKPHHNRTILKDFRFNKRNLKSLQAGYPSNQEFEAMPKSTIREMAGNIASLSNLRISTNDVLSAMVVKKLVARQFASQGNGFQLTMPVDVRRFIEEYGQNFLGNGIMFNSIDFEQSEIEKSDISDLALKIRKYMPTVTKEGYMDFLKSLENIIAQDQMNNLRPFDPGRGCLVTNLSKMPSRELDFGTGGADFIFPLTIEKNSAAILADEENFILRILY